VSLYRSGSPQMPRSIAGHGLVSTRYPTFSASVNGIPSSSRISAEMPGIGRCAEPGSSVVTPGSGLIMMPPVSVCHHVSTIGAVLPPMCLRYQSQASGLIGSPTLPSTRTEDRSNFAGCRRPTS
jgi:hypothetical protein